MAAAQTPEIIATVTKPYIDISCSLGEGPHYQDETGMFRFVDIMKKKVHRFHIDKGPESLESFDTADAVGVTYDIEGVNDKYIVAAKYGFALMDAATGKLTYIAHAWDDSKDGKGKFERMRFNDGAIDPAGRFYAGSMTDNALHEPINEGAIFRLDPDRSVHRVLEPVHIPNGHGWSADGKTMYLTDSPGLTIWAFDYDVETAAISNRRPWFKLEDAPDGAAPDGFAIDEHGDIWSAVYNGSNVIRLRDVGGKGVKVGEVRFPTPCITCPRFVGTELFVTSADDDGKESGAYGGRVFKIDVGVKGAKINKWTGSV